MGNKQGDQQFSGDIRLNLGARLQYALQAVIAFDDDQGSPPRLDQVPDALGDLLEEAPSPRKNPAPNPAPADLGDDAAKVGLENHDERDEDKGSHVAEQPIEGHQVARLPYA